MQYKGGPRLPKQRICTILFPSQPYYGRNQTCVCSACCCAWRCAWAAPPRWPPKHTIPYHFGAGASLPDQDALDALGVDGLMILLPGSELKVE